MDLLAWTQQRNIHLILDESFVDFSEKVSKIRCLRMKFWKHTHTSQSLKVFPNLMEFRDYALGIAASSDKEIIAYLRKNMAIWNINSFAEFYLQIYSKYNNDYQNACKNS